MFRSASGPAGLSINTGTANLFGSTPAQSTGTGFGTATAQQPQNTGSLFGAPTPASGGLFGGGGTTSQQQQQQQQQPGQQQQQQTPSLFGQPAQQPQQQQSTGGIFGQPQQQQQTGGGIFGQPAQQQQTSGGIFGQPAQQQQQQQPQQQQMSLFGGGTTTTPAATGGGLFGGGATTQQPAQSTGTSLFGGGAAQPAQQTGTTSLFGTAQPAQQTTGTTSLFGQPQQQQQQQQPQQQQTSLFGGTGGTSLFGPKPATTTGTTSLFGTAQPSTTTTQPASTGLSLSMGQSQNTTAAQNAAAGSKVDLPSLRSTTRFSDLTDSLQSQLTQIDESIQKCISDCSAINAFLPGHEQQLSSIPLDVSFVSRKSEGAAGALNSDVLAIASLKETVKKDAANARLSFKSIDQLRLPGGYWQAGLWSSASRSGGQAGEGNGAAKTSASKSGSGASKTGQQEEEEADAESNQDLIGYFSKTADEMDEMMRRFERNLGEIEVHLHGVQGNVLEQLQRAAGQKQLEQPSVNGEGQVDQRVVELAGVLRDFEESILKVAGVVGGVKEGITELQLRDFMGHGS
ncbi:hypothetical protein B0H65DRAFT_541698 [Neurospora tetraspora]|uniref:Nucleoporin NUP49/NSP49 n=1 Tax=Neurospora tetraspora TaxID=94610 RepID=A0AAE0MN48_9PEZI|nr:hypothetical protein B0H65DRAFT_541698 [Neurospora tetraspora]